MVTQVVNRLQVTHVLDYGCGHACNLAKNLKADHKVTYQAYDPAVPRFSRSPVPAQMVACIDVLEHIEPDYLEAVLDDLVRLTQAVAFLTICCEPANRVLPDGRNAHLIQEPLKWWLPKLWDRFDLQTVQMVDKGFFVIGMARSMLEAANGERFA